MESHLVVNTPRRRTLLTSALLALGIGLFGCTSVGPTASANKVRVAASFYPLAFFSQQVGGDEVEVVNLVPPGAEPHDWEPTPRDIGLIEASALFVYNGAGFEPWAERVIKRLRSERPIVVNTSEGLELLPRGFKEGHEEGGNQPEIKTSKPIEVGSLDPHVWLDPVLAQHQVALIRDALVKVDPPKGSVYEERAKQLAQRLATLHDQYQVDLSQCRKRTIFTAHAAFSYLAKRYKIETISIAGLSPDAEPGPARLTELAKLAREKQVRYIFFETLSSPALAQVLAREVGAQTLVFNPLEGLTQEEIKAGKSYFTVMEENLANLKRAMECR